MNESDNLLSNIFGEDEDHIFPPLPLRSDDGCNEGRGHPVRLTRVKVEEGEGAAVVTPRDIPLSSVHTPPLPPHEQSRQPSDDPFSEAPSPSASSRARVSSESESSSSSSLVAPSGVPPSLRHRNKFALREQWMVRFRELLEYRQEHDHCNVPQRGCQLGCWVSTQRTQYKLMLEGRQTQMSQERVDMLNDVGFNWDPRGVFRRVFMEGDEACAGRPTSNKRADRNDRKWQQWYTKLVRFHELHGHCLVTRSCDNSLGIWVQKQRKQYRCQRQGKEKSSQLTPARISLLNEIAFAWEVPSGSRPILPKAGKADEPTTGTKNNNVSRDDKSWLF